MKKNLAAAIVVGLVVVSSVTATSAFASTDDTRPGWGNGDKNHVHVGPPGQSVRPSVAAQLHDTEVNVTSNLEANMNIPSDVKDNLVDRITHLFDNLIHMFS